METICLVEYRGRLRRNHLEYRGTRIRMKMLVENKSRVP